jgi:hypothetical protein
MGGVPGQGAVVEGVKEVKYIPKPPGMDKNGKKGSFLHFLTKKRCIFTEKYLTRYTPDTFFRNV